MTHHSVVCNRTSVQECYDSGLKDLLMQMYEHDFTESKYTTSRMSQEDQKFLSIMEAEVKFDDGHYELPLPFRFSEVVKTIDLRPHSVLISGGQNRYFGVTVPNCYFPTIICYFLSVTCYPLLFVIVIA